MMASDLEEMVADEVLPAEHDGARASSDIEVSFSVMLTGGNAV